MLRIVPTSALGDDQIASIRSMLDAAFGGEFTDDDWEHGLGGSHVIVVDGDEIVGHAAVVDRLLWVGDHQFTVGYVEGVAVRPDRQGDGVGTELMTSIGELLAQRNQHGVLSTGAHRFYERLGWRRWRGATAVRRADGTIEPTPNDDDAIMVSPHADVTSIDPAATIVCAERSGDDW